MPFLLPLDFYQSSGVWAARNLLGKLLVRVTPTMEMTGIIVETEAYCGPEDQAAHSYNGRRTARTEIMYRQGGFAYIYQIHTHHCLNVTAAAEGIPHAVLIRSIHPTDGIMEMARNRGIDIFDTSDLVKIASGPGKLCQAMNIDRKLNGTSLMGNQLYILDIGLAVPDQSVVRTPRIGITNTGEWATQFWRFLVKGSSYISYPSAFKGDLRVETD